MLNILFFILVQISLLLADPQTCSTSIIPGAITYTNGSSVTNPVLQAGGDGSGEWGVVTPSGSQITLGLGPRAYIGNNCASSSFNTNVFLKFNPLGSTITFTVNLASTWCGTDAAFYLVGMPAANAGSNGDYYCDSNDGSGNGYCTEMDLIEANRHALQMTAHQCDGTSSCDGSGCYVNTMNANGPSAAATPNVFGPGSSYTINTENAFTMAVTFTESSGELTQVTAVLTQGSNTLTLTLDSSLCSSTATSLPNVGAAFPSGMVAVWSYWSGSTTWLDGTPCDNSNTDEISDPSFVFSNLIFSNGGSVTPPPTTPPTAPPKAPTTPPKAPTTGTTTPPTAPPKAPTTPPKAPTGTTSSGQTCSDSGCTINNYWVEFDPPSGASSPSAATATVLCSSGSTFSCTWYASGSKFQCNPGSNECLSPVPYYNGEACPYSTPVTAESTDGNAMTNGSLDVATVAGISAGCIVVVALVIVVIVLVLKNKNNKEEHV